VPLYLSTPLKVAPEPLVHVSCLTMPLVTAPIREPAVLVIVLVWKEPSRVTWHLTVTTPGAWNSKLVQVALMFWLLTESLVADAVLTAAASSREAASVVIMSFTDMRI